VFQSSPRTCRDPKAAGGERGVRCEGASTRCNPTQVVQGVWRAHRSRVLLDFGDVSWLTPCDVMRRPHLRSANIEE